MTVYAGRPAVKANIQTVAHYRDNCRLPKEDMPKDHGYGSIAWTYYQIYRRKADQARNRSLQFKTGAYKEDFHNRYIAYDEVADAWGQALGHWFSWMKWTGGVSDDDANQG